MKRAVADPSSAIPLVSAQCGMVIHPNMRAVGWAARAGSTRRRSVIRGRWGWVSTANRVRAPENTVPAQERYGAVDMVDAAAPERPVRIVLVDDHSVMRAGLRLLLDSEPGFEVVAEAGNPQDAARYVRGHHPDVLLLDLNMPGGSGLEL